MGFSVQLFFTLTTLLRMPVSARLYFGEGIVKKYWLQITEEEIISDKALEYFSKYGVAPLFPDYVSNQNGWKPETDRFLLTSSGGYFRVYEGTFFEEYPRRRIAVQVCFELENLVVPDGYVDAQFVFLIQRTDVNESTPSEDIHDIPTYIISIPVHQEYSRHLPRDIRDIENFLSPVILTPGVLVSLLSYITEQIPKIEGMSEQEHQRILDTHAKLQEFLLTMSISDQTFEPYGITIYSRGVQAFRDALFNIFRDRYPNYQSIMMSPSWRRLLDQYRQVLEQINSAQRRGIEPLSGQKSELAMLFEQRQYAGFESYAKQYNGLVEVVDWRGDSGSIIFHRHLQENILIEAISIDSGLDENEVYEISRQQGYLYEETQYLIDFLLLRGYIEHTENNNRLVLASTFTLDELIGIARLTLEELEFIKSLSSSKEYEQLHAQIATILTTLIDEKVDLSDAQVRLLQYQRQIQTECKQIVIDMRTTVQSRIENLYKYRARFDEPLLESSTGLFLDAHVNGAQRTLQKDITSLSSRIQKRISALREPLEQSIDLDGGDFAPFEIYVSQVQKELQLADREESDAKALLEQCVVHHDWVQLVDRLKRLKDMITTAAEITDTQLLEQTLERLQWDIQQELASEGLKQYRSIYNQFVEPINRIQRELETLSRLVETRSRNGSHSEETMSAEPTDQSQSGINIASEDDIVLSEQLETEQINLKSIFENSTKQESEFLHHLINLNETGEIVVYQRKKRK